RRRDPVAAAARLADAQGARGRRQHGARRTRVRERGLPARRARRRRDRRHSARSGRRPCPSRSHPRRAARAARRVRAARRAGADVTGWLESLAYEAAAIWSAGGWAMVPIAIVATALFALALRVRLALRDTGFVRVPEATWRR